MGDPQDCRQPVTASGQDAPNLLDTYTRISRGNHPRLTSSGRSSLGQWLRTQAFRDHQGAKAEVDSGPAGNLFEFAGAHWRQSGGDMDPGGVVRRDLSATRRVVGQRRVPRRARRGPNFRHFSGGPPSPGSLTAVDLFGPAFEERVGNNVAAFMAGTLGFVLMVARAI